MNALNKTVIWLWVATCVLLVVTGVMYVLAPEDGGANIGLGLLLVFVLPAVAIVTLGATIAAVVFRLVRKSST